MDMDIVVSNPYPIQFQPCIGAKIHCCLKNLILLIKNLKYPRKKKATHHHLKMRPAYKHVGKMVTKKKYI